MDKGFTFESSALLSEPELRSFSCCCFAHALCRRIALKNCMLHVEYVSTFLIRDLNNLIIALSLLLQFVRLKTVTNLMIIHEVYRLFWADLLMDLSSCVRVHCEHQPYNSDNLSKHSLIP